MSKEKLISKIRTQPNSTFVLGVYIQVINERLEEIRTYMRGNFFGRDPGPSHITLYMAAIPTDWESIVDQIDKKIDNVISHSDLEIELLPENIYGDKSQMFVGVKVEDDSFLQTHVDLVKAINPLRSNTVRTKDLDKLNEISELELQEISKNGYQRNGQNFHPHITFVYSQDDKKDQVDYAKAFSKAKKMFGKEKLTLKSSDLKLEVKVFNDVESGFDEVLYERGVGS